jgi:nucleoid DNA-binding protein
MGFGKKDIVKNISSKALFCSKTSNSFLNAFLELIKENKRKKIKISKFGSYTLHKSPARIGRNPKTKEEFKILPSEKLVFKASNNVKSILN